MGGSVIRTATPDDLDDIVARGAAFHRAWGTKIPYDGRKVREFVGLIIPGGGVFISERGMIGGAMVHPFCSDEWRMAVEFFWWAKGDGVSLLNAFEVWAKENNANEIRMTSLCVLKKAEKLLSSAGYAMTEISHSKVI